MDQYEGEVSKFWDLYIGSRTERVKNYSDTLVTTLRQKGYHRILDVACGNGIDSIMLLENGFDVVSIDASDKMLKPALKTRWSRRKENAFDNWAIEEANWLTLKDDLENLGYETNFDAVICLGNSFAHLPDLGNHQEEQRTALKNFRDVLRPGGSLIIDHRNYDYILKSGKCPCRNIYYNSKNIKDITTSLLYVNFIPKMIALDYDLEIPKPGKGQNGEQNLISFRLTYYPHLLRAFTKLLQDTFGENAKYEVSSDFNKQIMADQLEGKDPSFNPETNDTAFYIHSIEKN
ncbi:unnamed protein product [Gordionus sp. m RMFG-2023]